MGHPRRRFVHNTVHFVTNRMAEGLPLVPNLYTNSILLGILARAQFLYPDITVCHWVFMVNHFHGILVINGDPAQLADFMEYVQGEIGKVVVRILDKRNYKVWAQRYNSIELLDSEAVIKQISYIYLNAVEANLVAHASEWPGVHTWNELTDDTPKECKWIRPGKIKVLPNEAFTKRSLKTLVESIEEISGPKHILHFEPYRWKGCFSETRHVSNEELCTRIVAIVEEGEKRCFRRRKQDKQEVANRTTLQFQNPYKSYKPKKFGRRVFCMSTCEELRKEFIELYREFCRKCEEVWQSWKKSDFSVYYPPGAFIPSTVPQASIVCDFP